MNDKSRQKQLDIVLKLNKLTKKGKIEWARSTRATTLAPAEERGLFKVLEQYEAEYKGRTFRVEEISDDPFSSLRRAVLQTQKPDGAFRLVVIDPDDNGSNIIIPPIPAIEDLAQTIRRTYEEGEIEELDELNRLLEEDL